jgi:hypothetical protein
MQDDSDLVNGVAVPREAVRRMRSKASRTSAAERAAPKKRATADPVNAVKRILPVQAPPPTCAPAVRPGHEASPRARKKQHTSRTRAGSRCQRFQQLSRIALYLSLAKTLR